MNRKDHKEYKRYVEGLSRQGWDISIRKGGHYKLIPPWREAELVFTPASPSDCRVFNNLKARVDRITRTHQQGG